MIIDPHIHSKYSPCSKIGIKDLFNTAINKGLDAIIITDHNILSTRILLNFPIEYFDILKVFIGEEITTIDGDILAYGISEPIPQGLTAEKTINLIHDQNGIAVAAHPYRKSKKFGHKLLGLGDRIFDLDLDAIEGYNGNNSNASNHLAVKTAKKLNLPIIGGSDAHFPSEIGKVVLQMPEIDTIDEFTKLVLIKKFKVIIY
ncbi:MAG: PHP domain-containing protein [Candidatus Helarchaeota archaeon]